MKNVICLAFLSSSVVVLIALNIPGQDSRTLPTPDSGENFILQGRVFGPNGQPISRSIRVELRGPRASVQTVDTDNNGSFWFRAPTLGEYTVFVDGGEEFEPATASIDLDNLLRTVVKKSEGNSTQISIHLKPKRRSIIPARTTDARTVDVPPEAVTLYESGLKRLAAGELGDAIIDFRKAVDIYPAFYRAHTELGKAYLKMSQFDDAIRAFQSALNYDQKSFSARLHLGMAYLNQKKFELAEKELLAAADLDKTAVIPQYYVGVIKYEQNEFDAAQGVFEKARELNGDKPFPLLHKYLGSIYLKKSKWDLAAVELETYLSQAPDAKDTETIRKMIAELRSKPN